MLYELQKIVLDVSNTEDPSAAVNTIVHHVAMAMRVEQCSIYLLDPNDNALVLSASKGLRQEAVNNIRLSRGEGLVGTVGAMSRPLRIVDAAADKRFRHFPVTGESRFHAFLGVPVVYLRRLVGVLVVQSLGERTFDANDEAFLVTVSAQLAGIVHGAAIGEHVLSARRQASSSRLQGIPGAPGVAVGTPVLPSEFADLNQVRDRSDTEPVEEEKRFQQALTALKAEMHRNAEHLRDVLPEEALALFDVYVELAADPVFTGQVIQRIHAGQWAPAALRDSVAELAIRFEGLEEERFQARAEDIRGLGRRILLHLYPDARETADYPERCVLVGNEVSVARIANVPVEKLAGIICFSGSVHSHTAVVARSLGIPAVMGLGQVPLESLVDSTVVVDGYLGRILVDPLQRVLAEYLRLEREEAELAERVRKEESLDAKTADGHPVTIYTNIALVTDIEPALRAGATGVGLYRTEFPFLIRESFPTEDEQQRIYDQVLSAFSGLPVTMRTLDVGGDKALPYFPIDDSNPSLGWRGIRVSLNHPEIFVTQIRAMLRANEGSGNLRILLPMISTIAEIDEAKELIERTGRELADDGHVSTKPEIGVMLEVPGLLYQLNAVAERVDFVSIGTNDLTQYLMAADRDNANVVDLYDHLQPPVLAAIRFAVETLQKLNIPVSICGELASDPRGIVLALGMGVDILSVAAASLGKTKWVVRSFTRDEALVHLDTVMRLENVQDIKALLREVLEAKGVGGLVRAGK